MAFLDKSKELNYRKTWYKANANKLRAKSKTAVRLRRGYPEPTRQPSICCEICGKIFTKTPLLDHCHVTGKFRGWLCRNCNSMLGMSNDNIKILQAAIEYLKKN